MTHQDVCGNDLQPGDYIAYAVRRGDHACLKIGRVSELSQTNSKIKVVTAEPPKWAGGWRRQPRPVTLTKLDRVCVVRGLPDWLVLLLSDATAA